MFTFTLKSAAQAYYYSFELARDEVFMRFHLHLVKNNGPAGVAGGYLGISTSKNSLITCKQQTFKLKYSGAVRVGDAGRVPRGTN